MFVWHLKPEKPATQAQVKKSKLSVQVPPEQAGGEKGKRKEEDINKGIRRSKARKEERTVAARIGSAFVPLYLTGGPRPRRRTVAQEAVNLVNTRA
jgi:hypothetical protein